MKQKIFTFAALCCVVVAAIIVINKETGMLTCGNGGLSLKELNDTTKTNVVAMAQANVTSEEELAQVLTIAYWEKNRGSFFVGADLVGAVSTQFGVMCPTYDIRTGVDFNAFRLEAKVGNFTRNSVTATGFDPQYSNACILAGHSAAVSNAVQLSLIADGTLVYVGHQGGSDFYKFNGNYYVGAEQKIGKISLSGGVDFTENFTGYGAFKWSSRHDEITLNANNLGGETQNFILSYVHTNIPFYKDVRMHVGTSLWSQPQKQGLQLVTGLNKGKATLFAQAGGYLLEKTFTPVLGLGLNYNL